MQPQPRAKQTNTLLIVALVVIAGMCVVILVLGALLFPVFSQARLGAKKSQSLSEAKTISLGLLMYASDHDDAMPALFETTNDLQNAIAGYVDTKAIDFKSENPEESWYIPNLYAQQVKLSWVVDPAFSVMVYETSSWPRDYGRIVGCFDGSAQYVEQFDNAYLVFEVAPTE